MSAPYTLINEKILPIQTEYYGCSFSSDGTMLFMLSGIAALTKYNLAIPWDVSTIDSGDVGEYLGGTVDNKRGLVVGENGVDLLITGTGADKLYHFTLDVQWDVTNVTHVDTYTLPAAVGDAAGITAKSDGTVVYISDKWEIHEFTMSSGWDLSTISVGPVEPVDPAAQGVWQIWVSQDGLRLYTVAYDGDSETRIGTMSIPWDISSITWSDVEQIFDVPSLFPVHGMAFSSSEDRMIFSCYNSGYVLRDYTAIPPAFSVFWHNHVGQKEFDG